MGKNNHKNNEKDYSLSLQELWWVTFLEILSTLTQAKKSIASPCFVYWHITNSHVDLMVLPRLKKTRCWVTYIGMPRKNFKLSVRLAHASHNSRSGEDPIYTLYAFAGRLDLLHEHPGLTFLCELPHSIAGKLIMLPDVIVRAVSHP